MTDGRTKRRTVALIWGGKGKERQVSLLGKDYVSSLIDREKYSVIQVHIDERGLWHRLDKNGALCAPMAHTRGGVLICENGECEEIHVAIPFLHGDMGEDGRIQGALECAGIPLLGADTLCGAVCSDKCYTKAVAEELGIPTAKWVICYGRSEPSARRLCEDAVGYPMLIKPSRLGSSVGVRAVLSPDGFAEAFAYASELGGGRLIVEEYLSAKRELEVAYLSVAGRTIISHPAEVVCDGIYSYRKKYGEGAKTLTRAELSEDTRKKITEYCAALAGALDLRHLARIDFFLSGDRLLFNEINTMPGFTRTSLYPRIMSEEGIPPAQALNLMIEDTLRGAEL